MKLLLLFLCCCAPVFAQSTTIYNVNSAGNSVALTPSTVVKPSGPQSEGLIMFRSTLPSNWSLGEGFSFSLSFNGDPISGSGGAWIFAYDVGYVEFGFYLPCSPKTIRLQ